MGAYSRRAGEGGCDKEETAERVLFSSGATALWSDTSIHKPARGKASVKLLMYYFSFAWATFTCSLPQKALLNAALLRVGTGMWPVPAAHCASVQGPSCEFSIELLPTGPLQPTVLFYQM